MDTTTAIDHLFDGKPAEVRAAYDYLVDELRQFGPIKEAAKQTSIHLEKHSGFAGVHPRKNAFNLEFRTEHPIDNPRIIRQQQLSARRFEHTVKIESESDIDDQLLLWLREAYTLSK
jgi:hypothetical protein